MSQTDPRPPWWRFFARRKWDIEENERVIAAMVKLDTDHSTNTRLLFLMNILQNTRHPLYHLHQALVETKVVDGESLTTFRRWNPDELRWTLIAAAIEDNILRKACYDLHDEDTGADDQARAQAVIDAYAQDIAEKLRQARETA